MELRSSTNTGRKKASSSPYSLHTCVIPFLVVFKGLWIIIAYILSYSNTASPSHNKTPYNSTLSHRGHVNNCTVILKMSRKSKLHRCWNASGWTWWVAMQYIRKHCDSLWWERLNNYTWDIFYTLLEYQERLFRIWCNWNKPTQNNDLFFTVIYTYWNLHTFIMEDSVHWPTCSCFIMSTITWRIW